MSLDTDQIIDRRRLKRRLTFWRIAAVVAVIAVIVVAVGRGDSLGGRDYIARLAVQGVIFDNADRHELLAALSKDKNVKALIIRINSPGGTVVGGEALFHSVRKFSKKKPVVAVMGETATSAAYMVAIAADQIFAHAGSITGSIGVLMQTADVTKLLEKIGIKPEAVKSGPLKAQPNPMEPFSGKARSAIQLVITDLYDMFVDMVRERRSLTVEKAKKLADGRVFTGRQALKNGLLDALGGEAEARQWLTKTHKIDPKLPVEDVGVHRLSETWRELVGELVGKILFSERLRLDGPISVWHPELR
ncbi:MAG: signal peptide peptidase SppA [Rhodospirillales bacterium]|jgi:protease-4